MTARVSFVERAKRSARALAWIVLFAVVGLVAAYAAGLLVSALGPGGWAFAAQSAGQAGAFLFATWLVGRRLERRPWAELGWRAGRWPDLGRGLARGAGLGALMAATAIGLAFVASRARLGVSPEWTAWALSVVPLATALLAAALVEELLFRGYPLRKLADAFGPWPAVVLLAAGFALAHAGNPNVGVLGAGNIALAAVWLSFAFFSPGGMPFAWGLHFGWNAGLGLVFDAPVSGYEFRLPAVEYDPGRHAWLDGGAFGPEGGLVATVALIAGTLAVLGRRVGQPREWLAG